MFTSIRVDFTLPQMPNTKSGWLQAVEKAKLNLNILNVKETDKDSINSNQVLWNKVGSKAEENLN